MAYEVLARKWRPQTFDQVVGQDHITRTLQKAVELGRISHAYLFSGPRGCGKTSTARILAKVINCLDLKGGNPCDACESCVGVTQGKNLDMMEIDGASHTGVAEVRDLQESIGYAPSQYRNKIYIIDEVHMLSNHAFNALLKTLEEPPAHVYFIFATTAPHKIPETIKSRCQRHHFKRLEIGEIVGQLEKICKAEKVKCETDGLRLLARKAEGSMRDAESLLDQCITASSGQVTAAAVTDILGLLGGELVLAFLRKVAARNPTEVLKQLNQAIDEGVDLQELAAAFLEGFRDLMVLSSPGDLSDLVFRSQDEIESFRELLETYQLPDLVTIVERLCGVTARLKAAGDPRILFESVLVDITLLDRQVDLRELIDRLQSGRLPAGPAGGAAPTGGGGRKSAPRTHAPAESSGQPAKKPPAPGRKTASLDSSPVAGLPADIPLDEQQLARVWKDFVVFVRTRDASLGIFLDTAKPSCADGHTIQLKIPKSAAILRDQVAGSGNNKTLKRLSRKFFNRDVELNYLVAGSRPPAEAAGSAKKQRSPGSLQAIAEQPVVKKIIEDFDGEIVNYRP